MEDYHNTFKDYVMNCAEYELPPEDLCNICKVPQEFAENGFDFRKCPCFMSIDRVVYDDRGDYITVSCKSFKNNL